MTSKYAVIIENLKVKYEFTIKRKYTKIQGDSATGKPVRLCTKDTFKSPYLDHFNLF